MKSNIMFLGMTLVVLVGGCAATVPMASHSLDVEGKKFTPESGMASIYVHRGGGDLVPYLFQLYLDGQMVGAIAPYTYHLMTVKPGEHTIYVIARENAEQTTFMAEKAKNYFYKLRNGYSWPQSKVHILSIDEEEGRKLISDSKRAISIIYK